ncbi:MAG: hypothetical protein C5B43_02925 [Verrucomicrobia bacterium]|nr:MAG: hypothetical protein C5B43_02925 [Verrucomicrobiota bacterium]
MKYIKKGQNSNNHKIQFIAAEATKNQKFSASLNLFTPNQSNFIRYSVAYLLLWSIIILSISEPIYGNPFTDFSSTVSLLKQKEGEQNFTDLEAIAKQSLNNPKFSNEQKAELYGRLAIAYDRQNKYIEAERALTEGLKLPDCSDQRRSTLYALQAFTYLEQSKYGEAEIAIAEGLKLPCCSDESKASLYSQRAITYINQHKHREAEIAIVEGLRLPECPEYARTNLRAILYNKILPAIDYSNSSSTTSKASIDLSTTFSLLKQMQKDQNYAGMESFANVCLNNQNISNDQKVLLYITLAEAFYKQSKFPEAEKAITEGLKTPAPDVLKAQLYRSLALICICQSYTCKDKHFEAENAITEGLKLSGCSNDTRAELYYLRALSYVNQDKYVECEKAVAEGLILPDCPNFTKGKLYYVQSVVYNNQGKYLEAKKAIAELQKLSTLVKELEFLLEK